MWQISMTPAPISFIFGTYHVSGFLIPSAKYKRSMVNGQPFRGHHSFGTGLTLKKLKFLFINLENRLKYLFVRN